MSQRRSARPARSVVGVTSAAVLLGAVMLGAHTVGARGPGADGTGDGRSDRRTVQPLDGEAASALRDDVITYLEGTDPQQQVRAVLVEVGGETALEHYVDAGPDDYFDVRSVTKSVVSAAVGVAIEEGRIGGVDQTLAELLPDRAADMSPAVADVTLEQVLTHTAGFPADDGPGTDWWEHEDRVGAVLEAGEGPSDPPVFAYSSGGSHLLAAVLAEATGEPVLDHVGRTVLDPLGVPHRPVFEPRVPHDIDDEAYADLYDEYMSAGFAWPRDPQGVHDGGCCMRLRAVDLLALGRLYLHEGRAGGRQVLPAGWVQASTGAHVDTRDFFPAYGYQWWVGDADDHDAFVAYGYGGQMIEVLPDLDTVVVVVTEIDDRDPMAGTTLFGAGEATYMVELAVLPHLFGSVDVSVAGA